MKYVKRFANLVSILFAFVYIPVQVASDYSAQTGMFSSRQGPDTAFSKDCVQRYLPNLAATIEGVYCQSTSWIDTSARILFKVPNEDVLQLILQDYVLDTHHQHIFAGCETPAWWRASVEGGQLIKYRAKKDPASVITALWLQRQHNEITIFYEYSTI